jgi:uncharacterized membrane-anchored protein
MSILPPDHALRRLLAEEVHARPPEAVRSPARASYVAVLVDADERERERRHLEGICQRHAVAPPAAGATHFRADLGGVRLKWERHGEFSGYTFIVDGVDDENPFTDTAAARLPVGWLAAMPGRTMAAVHAELRPAGALPPDAAALAHWFDRHTVVGAAIADGAAQVYTDFQLYGDGCTHLLVFDHGLGERSAGRTLQRLFEIEAYRMLALLALPIARRQAPRVAAIEDALSLLTDGIARDAGDDEALLQELTRLAAEVESGIAASQFRFGACEAYHGLVLRRIVELREVRLPPGFQTIDEFMGRRLTPAVATCATVSQRLRDLAERVAQASALLSTRVDIARERQNQKLLASMDLRARQQLRLQQTVEGLSVAAIVYYVAGLVGYGAKALHAAGLRVEPEIAVGAAIPFIAVLVVWAVRRARRHIDATESLLD